MTLLERYVLSAKQVDAARAAVTALENSRERQFDDATVLVHAVWSAIVANETREKDATK